MVVMKRKLTQKSNLVNESSYKTTAKLNGQEVIFKIGTGSGVTLINKEICNRIGGKLHDLEKSRLI